RPPAPAVPEPAPVPEQTAGREPDAVAELSDRWVLIIDRDVRSLVHLAELIRAEGLLVQTAADLEEALETLQEDPEGCVLVLLAAQVSEAETCDTIKSLLKQDHDRETAIAVLGDAEAQAQTEACRASGAVAFLAKPVEAHALHTVLAGLHPSAGAGPVKAHSLDGTGVASGQTP
ncbi:MAG: response regulator, partial [Chromatiaceae bacterium]